MKELHLFLCCHLSYSWTICFFGGANQQPGLSSFWNQTKVGIEGVQGAV